MTTTVRRILVLANRTCPCPALREELQDRAATHDGTEVMIVAPALNSSRLAHWVSDSDESVRDAEMRLAETIEFLRQQGVAASGQVGDADPFNALQDTLHTFEADEVIISTHPPGRSHWLEEGLPERTRAAFTGPVAHFTSGYDA